MPQTMLLQFVQGNSLPQYVNAFMRALEYFFYEGSLSIEFACYVVVTKDNYREIKAFLTKERIRNVKPIIYCSVEYFRILARVNYLYSDSPFPEGFYKRMGQVFLYDTAACPINEINEVFIGTIQKDLISADYIYCTKEKEVEELNRIYYLDKIYQGKLVYQSNLDLIENAKGILSNLLSSNQNVFKKKKGKKNVLIFCSDLRKNGMTTSLINLIKLADRENINYFFTYQEELFENHLERLCVLPMHTYRLPVAGAITHKTVLEALFHSLYFRFSWDTRLFRKYIFRLYQREYESHFSHICLDEVIHFTGYAPDFTLLLQSSPAKRVIFAHNDMYEEYVEKKNFHMPTLLHAYQTYECIAAVSPAVKESLKKFSIPLTNVVILENAHDAKGVLDKSEQPYGMEAETEVSLPLDRLRLLLASDIKKFITVGRFSAEKGHKKLMNAFAKFYDVHSDTVLIIIGGYGTIYEETLLYKDTLRCRDNIIIIKSISNPFAILKQCDLFILPSDREPLGLVLLEADTLLVPIVATDIPGSGDFLRRFGGYLVENSEDGLIVGMNAYMEGRVKPLNIPFEQYNKNIIYQFEHLFDTLHNVNTGS